MKTTKQCQFLATVERCEIRRTQRGQDYLSLTVKTLDDDPTPCWVTSFHDLEQLREWIRPEHNIYVEGKFKIRSWVKDGEQRFATAVTADKIVVLFDVDGRPKEKKPKDEEPKPKRTQAELALLAGPAPVETKQYDHDFNDPLSF